MKREGSTEMFLVPIILARSGSPLHLAVPPDPDPDPYRVAALCGRVFSPNAASDAGPWWADWLWYPDVGDYSIDWRICRQCLAHVPDR